MAGKKGDLKKAAQRQEIIDLTTDPNTGERWFMMDKKLTHIRAKVRDCYVAGSTVTIKLLFLNLEARDDVLAFVGDLYSNGYDDEDKYIHSSKVSFAVGNSDRFDNMLNEVLIPGGRSVLKVTMRIKDINPNINSFKELKFGLKTDLTGGEHTYTNYIYDLNVRR